jgi:hypothetical protein
VTPRKTPSWAIPNFKPALVEQVIAREAAARDVNEQLESEEGDDEHGED